MKRTKRPVFLDLRHIQMPVGALASIGHRISGVVLSMGVPLAGVRHLLSDFDIGSPLRDPLNG